MKIWQKIGLGFLMVIVANLIGMGVMFHFDKLADEAENRADALDVTVQNIDSIIADHVKWKLNVVISGINETMPRVEVDPAHCRLGKLLEKLKPQDDSERTLLEQIKVAHDQMHQGAHKLQALFAPGADVDDLEDAYFGIYNKEINGSSKKVFAGLDKLQKLFEKRAESAKEYSEIAEDYVQKANIGANLLVIVVAIIFGCWLFTSINRSVKGIQQRLVTVAEGDFSRDLPVEGKDEIAQLAVSINNMLASLRPLIKKVTDGAGVIEREVVDMETYSEEAAAGGKAAAVRAEEMVRESESILTSVDEETGAINEISAAIQEISQNTAQANNITNEAVEKASSAGDIINRLGQVSNDVQGIIKLISDIAEQTNLLALNATIEAARAGEAGKGFAVVANEVKELAKQTASSTEEITSKINAIQAESEAAVKVTNDITGIVGQINDITSTIAAAVEEQSAVISDIALKVEDQNSSAQNMVDNARVSMEAAENANRAAKTNLEKLKELVDLARGFKEHTAQFRI